MTRSLLSPAGLETELRAIGAERYHDRHPFHHLMRDGRLDHGQIQAWAVNRYYYQARIPAKDAYLVARLPTPALRREWPAASSITTATTRTLAASLAGSG